MGRKAGISFYESRNAYYTQYRGKQHKLGDGPEDAPEGPNYLAALKAYGELMAYGTIDTAKDNNTARTLFEAYMDFVESRRSVRTLQIRRHHLQVFINSYGHLRIHEIKPFHVDDVINKMRKPHKCGLKMVTWNNTTAGMFCASLSAALNWGIRQRITTINPLSRMERPTYRSKARERVITPEEHRTILQDVTRHPWQWAVANVIIALENSGARPGEIRNAKVSDWNDEHGAIVYYGNDRRREDEFAHKTAYKNKDRVILFTGDALAMIRRLVSEKKPGDLLFPNRHGEKYSGKSLVAVFDDIRTRLEMRHLVPNAYRHTLATRWLLADGSIDVLAELLGNTPETIRKHYSHLCKDHDAIRAKLEAFKKTSGLS